MQIKFIAEIQQHKLRAVKTLITYLCYICIGLQGSLHGITLLDLQVLAECTFNQISLTVTGRSIGYAIGSIISGYIDTKMNTQLTLSIFLLVSASTQVVIPFCKELSIMIIIYSIAGIATGILDCISNVFILKLWSKECFPFLQGLQFSFGLGGLSAAIIAGPYVRDQKKSEFTEKALVNSSALLTPDDIELFTPYAVAATVTSLSSLLFLFLFFNYRETSDHPSRYDGDINSNEKSQVRSTCSIKSDVRIMVIFLSSCFMLFYVGFEKTIGAFIIAFVHEGPLKLSKQIGAKITTAYWITFSVFKIVAIFAAEVLGSHGLIIINLTVATVSCGLLVIAPSHMPILWLSFILLGIGSSSTWSSMFGFLESKFPLDGKIVAYFTVGACIGASIFPPLVGYFMSFNNAIFAWFAFTSCLFQSFLFLIIFLVCKIHLFADNVTTKQSE